MQWLGACARWMRIRSGVGVVCAALAWTLLASGAEPRNGDESQASGSIALSPANDLAPFAGLAIRRIEIEQAGKWRSPATVQSVKLGEAFSGAVARRAARELLDTGAFANVTAEVDRLGDGVLLRLRATPRRVVASLRLVGSPIDEEEVWRVLGVLKGEEVTEQTLQAAPDKLRRLLAQRGFPSASARLDTRETDNPKHIVVVVWVNPGPALSIHQRVLVLPPQASELTEVANRYAVGRGDRADELALNEADQKLAQVLQGRGYPHASVAHRLVNERSRAVLYVYVRPGALQRLRFEGNEHFDHDQLTDAIEYDTEADRTQARLASKLEAFYVSVGFYDVQVRTELRGLPTDAVQDLVFHIREGQPAQVVSRSYPCLSEGVVTASDIDNEIDSILIEQLPGGDLLGTVDPAVVDEMIGPRSVTGARPVPWQPNPRTTFDPTVYDRAIKHVQDLLRSKGYLAATVGPVQLVRRRCAPGGQPHTCQPLPLPAIRNACTYDARGLPLSEPDLDSAIRCRPDGRRVRCERDLTLRIPIKLGPMALLHDLAFEGAHAITEQDLSEVADLKLGAPASNFDLEQARRRVIDAYRELGYAFAEVRAVLDLSPDHTRARARFTITEGEQVIVDRFIVRGAQRTSESLILGRVALQAGQPYRQGDVRKTEQRIATLGTFSSVAVGLEDPYVPARRKAVVIHVHERTPQYLDIRPGFSTGEGFRAQFEYGHLNIAGEAIQFTLRLRVSYLPEPFILDEAVRENLATLSLGQRLERHNTASLLFPEIGFGPLVSLGVDGVDVRSNARDFGLSKNALAVAFNYRPLRTVSASVGASLERNDVAIFGGETVEQYLQRPGVTSDLRRLLLAPDGLTIAVAQRLTGAWDRRDNPLGAKRGTLLGATIEHVRAFPGEDNPMTLLSDFMRVTGVFNGYVPLSRSLTLAGSLRGGRIFQLKDQSETYPDRLFFLGGVDSVRGFLPDAVVPQDVVDRILASQSLPANDPNRLSVDQVAIRGGDVFINPRAELRIALSGVVQTALFLDTGNVWVEPSAFDPFVLRYAAGSGLRVVTPIGPIALDYGVNLHRQSWEDFGAFHFSIGVF